MLPVYEGRKERKWEINEFSNRFWYVCIIMRRTIRLWRENFVRFVSIIQNISRKAACWSRRTILQYGKLKINIPIFAGLTALNTAKNAIVAFGNHEYEFRPEVRNVRIWSPNAAPVCEKYFAKEFAWRTITIAWSNGYRFIVLNSDRESGDSERGSIIVEKFK